MVGNRSRLWFRTAQFVAMSVAAALLYGMMLCAVDEALEFAPHGRSEAAEPAGHHDPSESHHHSRDDNSPDCCATFLSAVPDGAVQLQPPSSQFSAFPLWAAVPPVTAVLLPPVLSLYEHGPPGDAPPVFLSFRSVASRAPPFLA